MIEIFPSPKLIFWLMIYKIRVAETLKRMKDRKSTFSNTLKIGDDKNQSLEPLEIVKNEGKTVYLDDPCAMVCLTGGTYSGSGCLDDFLLLSSFLDCEFRMILCSFAALKHRYSNSIDLFQILEMRKYLPTL